MSVPGELRRLPVLVTGTFRDMRAERDHLHNVVFPELQRRLLERGFQLDVIDPWWGVEIASADEEHDQDLRVLEVSLREIYRGRPLQIVLLGDCWGWVPPSFPFWFPFWFPSTKRIEYALKAAGVRTESSTAFGGRTVGQTKAGHMATFEGMSVSVLQVYFGVLGNPEQEARCFVYSREPLPYDRMAPDMAALYSDAHRPDTGVQWLAGLKEDIRRKLPPAVRPYRAEWDEQSQTVTGLEAWGRMVLEDLWPMLDAQTRELAPRTRGIRLRGGGAARAPADMSSLQDDIVDKTDDYIAGLSSDITPAKDIHLDENVQFTVYRPGVVRPARWYPLLAFAHLSERRPDAPEDEPDPIAEVARQARLALAEKLEAYQDVRQESRQAVPREGELTFVPAMPGIEFNPPRRSFFWQESVHREEFKLRASAEMDGRTARGCLTVFLGSIILAEVSLNIRVASGPREASPASPMETARSRPYRKIFASYSHQDMQIVAEFERYANALGDRYLRDWIDLRAGEDWNDRLGGMIDEADVFQLFWSSSSMRSRFVRQEWEYALSLERQNFVRPVYWEEPLPASDTENLPPDELRRLHFQRILVAGGRDLPAGPISDLETASVDTTQTSGIGRDVGSSPVGFESDPGERRRREPVPTSTAEEIEPRAPASKRSVSGMLGCLVVLVVLALLSGFLAAWYFLW